MLNGKQCMRLAYRPSYGLLDAKKACFADVNCAGVYDNYCDNKPPFYLCSKARENMIYNLEDSSTDFDTMSCIHEKEGKCRYILSFP